jgi:hypothetical protein
MSFYNLSGSISQKFQQLQLYQSGTDASPQNLLDPNPKGVNAKKNPVFDALVIQ